MVSPIDESKRGFLFLGSGSSSSIPKLSHLSQVNIKNIKQKELEETDLKEITQYIEKLIENGIERINELNNIYLKKLYKNEKNVLCYTCFDALREDSKNRRNNISLLLKSDKSYVLIDCGKTFRASLLSNRTHLDFKKNRLEKVLISHSHADAIGGLDDLRDLQQFIKKERKDSFCYVPECVIQMYLNDVCFNQLRKSYKYMTNKINEYYLSKVPVIAYYVLKEDLYNRVLEDEKEPIGNKTKNIAETKNVIEENENINNEKKENENEKEEKEKEKENEESEKKSEKEGEKEGEKKGIIDKEQVFKRETENEEIRNLTFNKMDNKETNYNEQPKQINNIIEYSVKDEHGYIYTEFDKDIRIRFIPFEHGENYICIGFIVGNKNKIVYISDCSKINNYTLRYIQMCSPISVLIIDALFYKKNHYSHFSLSESVDFALKIKPLKVYFIGMSCEIEHNITNMFLKKLSEKIYPHISFELAYDGLFVPFDF